MNNQRILHVDWNLLDSATPGQDGRTVYSPDLLRRAADNIFLFRADGYQITLGGVAHPYYFDLVEYLANKPAPLEIYGKAAVDDTLAKWTPFLGKVAKKNFSISLAMPASADLYKAAFEFIGKCGESGQRVGAIVNGDLALLKMLNDFRKIVPFEIYNGSSGPAGAFNMAQPNSQTPAGNKAAAIYCVQGENYIRIEANGHFKTALCEQSADLGIFWSLKAEDLPDLFRIVRCAQSVCPHAGKVRKYEGATGNAVLNSLKNQTLPKRPLAEALKAAEGQPADKETAAISRFANPVIPGKVSLIVPFYNNADTIERCLASAFIQGIQNFEIIAVDDGSTDDTARIVSDLARLWPGFIRLVRLSENMGPGPARNMGLQLATGEYMAFIDADDCLAPGFLKRGLGVMAEEGADIVAFDMLQVRKGRYIRNWQVKEGVYAGWNSLEQLLLKNAGRYAAYSRLYRTEFLRKNNIQFGSTKVHEDIFFSVLSFFHSAKTVVISDIGYLRHQRPGVSYASGYQGEEQLRAFAEFIRFISDLFDRQGLDKTSPAYRFCVSRLYTWDRGRMLQAVREFGRENSVIQAAIMDIGQSEEALRLILADYALLHGLNKKSSLMVLAENRDWLSPAAFPTPEPVVKPYKNADSPGTSAPDISVIIPSHNSARYLSACLQSIYDQLFENMEIIITDDASTDNTFDLLKQYADADRRIRLYRLAQNCRQGIARNLGLKKARGKYIIFVDSDDICLPGFFKDAWQAMENNPIDMAIYGSDLEQENGTVWRRPTEREQLLTRNEAIRAFWDRTINPEPWAKIYRTETLKAHNCEFPAYIYHQDVPFVLEAIKASWRVMIRPRTAYTRIYSKDSTIRPKSANYLQIHSAFKFYHLIDRAYEQSGAPLAERDRTLPFIGWNLENVLLGKIDAFMRATGEVPMRPEDFSFLKENRTFLISLLEGAARALEGNEAVDGLVACHEKFGNIWNADFRETPVAEIKICCAADFQDIDQAINSLASQSMPFFVADVLSPENAVYIHTFGQRYMQDDKRFRFLSDQAGKTDQTRPERQYLVLTVPQYRFASDALLLACAWLDMEPELDCAIPVAALDPALGNYGHKKANAVLLTGRELIRALYENRIEFENLYGAVWRNSKIGESLKNLSPFEADIALLNLCGKAEKVLVFSTGEGTGLPTQNPVAHPLGTPLKILEAIDQLARFLPADAKVGEESQLIERVKKQLFANLRRFSTERRIPLSANELDLSRSQKFIWNYFLHRAKASREPLSLRRETVSLAPLKISDLFSVLDTGQGKNPAISLIMYAQNDAEWLRENLPSIMEQAGEDIELIIIDDSSQDSSIQVYLDFAEQMPESGHNIRILQTPYATGQGESWKLGLVLARGEYVFFGKIGKKLPSGWLNRMKRQIPAGADLVLTGIPVTEKTEMLSAYFNNELSLPVYRRAYLADLTGLVKAIASSQIPLLLEAMAKSKNIAIHAAKYSLETERVEAALDANPLGSLLRFHETMLKSLMGFKEREILAEEYARWLFKPERGYLEGLLDALPADLLLDSAELDSLLTGDAHMKYLLRALANA